MTTVKLKVKVTSDDVEKIKKIISEVEELVQDLKDNDIEVNLEFSSNNKKAKENFQEPIIYPLPYRPYIPYEPYVLPAPKIWYGTDTSGTYTITGNAETNNGSKD
jgi:hypothetical protein